MRNLSAEAFASHELIINVNAQQPAAADAKPERTRRHSPPPLAAAAVAAAAGASNHEIPF